MNLNKINTVFLIGIGGIGMSALARYFNKLNKKVIGYDLTASALTSTLIAEGINIYFDDKISNIPKEIKQNEDCIIIYTPAVPSNNNHLNYFITEGYKLFKRSQILGIIANNSNAVAVAGTHGKTSVSGLLSHILLSSTKGCTAFVGGIMKNYSSNFVYSPNSSITVVEADEFDKSFLQLQPLNVIITSVDADHLDIYKNYENLKNSFKQFAEKIKPAGNLLIHKSVDLKPNLSESTNYYTYAVDEQADFYASSIKIENGETYFDLHLPKGIIITNLHINLPGRINIENAVAASSMAWLLGVEKEMIFTALSTFTGIYRRFDFQIKTDNLIYMDDYAHHPEEISAMLSSVMEVYPNKKLTGIFQPHLFSRTQDFADGFAKSLSMLDEVILLDIYPAREMPIEGVSSKLIYDRIINTNKTMCLKADLLLEIENREIEFLITIGAGNIGEMRSEIKKLLEKRL